MKRSIIAIQVISSLLFVSAPVIAAPPVFVTVTVMPSGRAVVIPDRAAEVAPNVFELGTAVDPASGETVEGYLIVHRRDQHARPSGGGGAAKNNCYNFIARGAKWRVVEPWIANPANSRGLDQTQVASILSAGISKWEDAADGVVGNISGADILGAGTVTASVLSADTVAPDGANEVYFADIADSNAIAVTIVWYNRFSKSLLEWDQVYDDVSYDWSSSGEAGKMDLENIVTHELGHSIGLGDLYNSCTNETMYGYADFGETKKRDLNTGDIAGANVLY